MQLEELNSMKYGELFKLAKEKLNITRRASKEQLIEKLLKWHQNVLADFISADESAANSTVESEPVQRRGRKRGNQESEQPKPSSKKTKKAKKEAVEHTLNSTFSVDEDEITADLPVVTSKPVKTRKLRGKKKNAYLTEESSANDDSEAEKAPRGKKSRKVEPSPNNSLTDRVPVIILKRLDTSELNEDNSLVVSSPLKEPVPTVLKGKVSLPKPAEPANEPEPIKTPVRRTRNSGEIPLIEETINLRKSPQAKPKSPVKKSALPQRTLRKSIVSTPMSANKKGVQFTSANKKPKAAPNFAEIHQKNFLKMQSVDEYVERKRTRTETMSSVKTTRTKPVFNSKTPDSMTKFNFVSGLQKPVFTAKGQVVNEKQRVMATVKENLHNSSSLIPVTVAAKGKRKASMLSPREVNVSKLSLAGKQILKGVRTNRRFDLQMQHRNMKN